MNKGIIIAIVIFVIILIFGGAAAAWWFLIRDSGNGILGGILGGGNSLPEGIQNGDVIQADGVGIYKVENGQKRHYTSWEGYLACGRPPYQSYSESVLNSIPDGPDMPPC